MADLNPTTAREFYDRQIRWIEQNNVDALIDNNYREDAELVALDYQVRGGRQAFKEHFKNYLGRLGGIKVKSTDKFTSTADAIFFEATVVTGTYGEVHVYDAMVLKDGQIWRHFTGVK